VPYRSPPTCHVERVRGSIATKNESKHPDNPNRNYAASGSSHKNVEPTLDHTREVQSLVSPLSFLRAIACPERLSAAKESNGVSVVGFPVSRFSNFGDFGNHGTSGNFPSCLRGRFFESPDFLPQLHHVQRTVLPIMLPAHNHVALVAPVPVLAEIPALKFKFNPHALPQPGRHLPHG
jgi:hypothetical protein